jgi:uncharacterized membrane protein
VTHRMVAAALGLVGLLVSLYLWLWKVGLLGALACGDGGCETVQMSPYAYVFGIPVALLGLAGYLGIFAVALAGLQPRFAAARWPTDALLLLATGGVAFSAYLTYLEAAVIHAWCQWCIVSAGIIVAIFVAVLAGRIRWKPVAGSR